jgi:hypothetical protein
VELAARGHSANWVQVRDMWANRPVTDVATFNRLLRFNPYALHLLASSNLQALLGQENKLFMKYIIHFCSSLPTLENTDPFYIACWNVYKQDICERTISIKHGASPAPFDPMLKVLPPRKSMRTKEISKAKILEWASKCAHQLLVLPPSSTPYTRDEFESVFADDLFQSCNDLFQRSTSSESAPILLNIWTGIFAPLSQIGSTALSVAAALMVVRGSTTCNTSWHPALKVFYYLFNQQLEYLSMDAVQECFVASEFLEALSETNDITTLQKIVETLIRVELLSEEWQDAILRTTVVIDDAYAVDSYVNAFRRGARHVPPGEIRLVPCLFLDRIKQMLT